MSWPICSICVAQVVVEAVDRAARGSSAPGRRTGARSAAPPARRAATSGSSAAAPASSSRCSSVTVCSSAMRGKVSRRYCGSTSDAELRAAADGRSRDGVDRGRDGRRPPRAAASPSRRAGCARARAGGTAAPGRARVGRPAREIRSRTASRRGERVGRLLGRADDADQRRERRVARAPRGAPARRRGSRRRRGARRRRSRARRARASARARGRAVPAAPGAAGELRDERERALLGAEVGEAQRLVGVEHDAERHVGEVVALGDHLRADEHARAAPVEALQRARDRALAAARGVGVEPQDRELGSPSASSSSVSSRSVPAPWRATDDGAAVRAASSGSARGGRSGGRRSRPRAGAARARRRSAGSSTRARTSGRRGSSTSRGG